MLAAARAISPVLRPGNLVLLESTSPVGTTEQLAKVIAEVSVCGEQLHIAYCPERVLPGRILQELISNDRVIGGVTLPPPPPAKPSTPVSPRALKLRPEPLNW